MGMAAANVMAGRSAHAGSMGGSGFSNFMTQDVLHMIGKHGTKKYRQKANKALAASTAKPKAKTLTSTSSSRSFTLGTGSKSTGKVSTTLSAPKTRTRTSSRRTKHSRIRRGRSRGGRVARASKRAGGFSIGGNMNVRTNRRKGRR